MMDHNGQVSKPQSLCSCDLVTLTFFISQENKNKPLGTCSLLYPGELCPFSGLILCKESSHPFRHVLCGHVREHEVLPQSHLCTEGGEGGLKSLQIDTSLGVVALLRDVLNCCLTVCAHCGNPFIYQVLSEPRNMLSHGV